MKVNILGSRALKVSKLTLFAWVLNKRRTYPTFESVLRIWSLQQIKYSQVSGAASTVALSPSLSFTFFSGCALILEKKRERPLESSKIDIKSVYYPTRQSVLLLLLLLTVYCATTTKSLHRHFFQVCVCVCARVHFSRRRDNRCEMSVTTLYLLTVWPHSLVLDDISLARRCASIWLARLCAWAQASDPWTVVGQKWHKVVVHRKGIDAKCPVCNVKRRNHQAHIKHTNTRTPSDSVKHSVWTVMTRWKGD